MRLYLHTDETANIPIVAFAYAESPTHIRTLRFEPYIGYVARRTMVEFEW